MKIKVRIVLAAIWVVICLCLSCSEEKNIICPTVYDNVMVRVSGQVLAFRCLINEWDWNNIGRELRYTVETGEKATVRFTRKQGMNYLVETDDSSFFKLAVDTGTYTVVVECGHAWPDSFYNVYIGYDTTMDLKILYDYFDSENIYFAFYYGASLDTVTEVAEREILDRVNRVTGRMFYPMEAVRRVDSALYTGLTVYYTAPMSRPRSVGQAVDRIRLMLTNPYYQIPDILRVSPAVAPCLN